MKNINSVVAPKKWLQRISIFILACIILFPSFSALSYEAAPSDPQEDKIIQVIRGVMREFGWEKDFTWTHHYTDHSPKYYSPEIEGPRAVLQKVNDEYVPAPNVASYGINIVPPTANDVLPMQYTPLRIVAYRTVEQATKEFEEELTTANAMYKGLSNPIVDFHGMKAVHVKEMIFEWRMGRFILSSLDYYMGTKRIPEREVAEVLYKEVVKSGLAKASDASKEEEPPEEDTKEEEPPSLEEAVFTLQWEQNPSTSKPFQGIALDGVSTISLQLQMQNIAAGDRLQISTKPKYGTLSGDALLSNGSIDISKSSVTLTYTPKKYIPASAYDQPNSMIPTHFATDIIGFTYTPFEDSSGSSEEKEPTRKEQTPSIQLSLYRPPVMLVHGFTGDQTTWAMLAEQLRAQHYDTHIGSYYALDHSIQAQARELRGNIQFKKDQYAQQHIRLSRVDIIAHSMGGLLSRFYTNNASYYQNDVRKLLMVGTPNHGCSWTDLQIGRVQSYLRDKHKIAAQQLYSQNPFIQNLNSGESQGSHLVPAIEYGNIFSYSALPGFFSGDVVVSAASAHLNGVETYRLIDHTHSSTFSSVATSITQSQQVFTKLQYWLEHPIRRIPLRNVSIKLSHGEGEVYVKRLDTITSQGIPETPVDTTQKPFQSVSIQSFDYIGTHQGKAMISLYLNDIPWGYIHLDANTELRLGYVSPRSIEVKLLWGKARFTSFSMNGKGHFSVNVQHKNGDWQNIIGLDTDYVVEKNQDSVNVYSLHGDVMINTEVTNQEVTGQPLSSKKGFEVTSAGTLNPYSPTESSWWNNSFYESNAKGWTTLYFSDLWLKTVSQTKVVWAYVTQRQWSEIPFQNIWNLKLGISVFILALLAFFILFLTTVTRKAHLLIWIPLSIVLIGTWYTLSQYGILPFI
ncbi:MAG: alpha/beta fold hydrolase [Caldisericia bacterium]|nr:alpha/beta fold hydrolase [Caldisericia bacterium]